MLAGSCWPSASRSSRLVWRVQVVGWPRPRLPTRTVPVADAKAHRSKQTAGDIGRCRPAHAAQTQPTIHNSRLE